MKSKFLIIPAAFLFQFAGAQNGSSLTPAQESAPAPVSALTSTPSAQPAAESAVASPETKQITYLEYKSVYEAATIEEEVKMAAERFNLTASQQDMWLTAATDRRAAEKQAREKLETKAGSYERDGIYRGLRTSHNVFYETITGYLTPTQKQALETDRQILEEKRKKMAKLPPPPPPAPTVSVAPVDSAALNQPEKGKSKKAKKKKKASGA